MVVVEEERLDAVGHVLRPQLLQLVEPRVQVRQFQLRLEPWGLEGNSS